jgi:hypothetical protein
VNENLKNMYQEMEKNANELREEFLNRGSDSIADDPMFVGCKDNGERSKSPKKKKCDFI